MISFVKALTLPLFALLVNELCFGQVTSSTDTGAQSLRLTNDSYYINPEFTGDVAYPLDSQQVAVVAKAELQPQETGYGHHDGHGHKAHHSNHHTGYHKGSAHKANKGFKEKAGSKGTHHKSHDKGQKSGHHKKDGQKYKGLDHKHRHHLSKADGAKGQKGYHHKSKGHHHKGNKANGHKLIRHKEESGRQKKFFDDYEHKKYHSKYDDFKAHHKASDNSHYLGALHKGQKHHDKHGKEAFNDKGKYHDTKKGQKKSYGHKDKYGHHHDFGKKGSHKKAHATGHGGYGGHSHGGAHSVHRPVEVIHSEAEPDTDGVLTAHTESFPLRVDMPENIDSRQDFAPVSIFIRDEDKEEDPDISTVPDEEKITEGTYAGYLENDKVNDKNDDELMAPFSNDIPDTEKPVTINKFKAGIPILEIHPFRTEDNTEFDSQRIPNSESLVPIPILDGAKSQQVSVVIDGNLNSAETGKGKGYDKSKGHKASHHKSSGGEGAKGQKKSTGYKGDHHGDHHKKHHSKYLDKGGKKFHKDDHKKKYKGGFHAGKKGQKGHSSGSKGHHHKGHQDKGFKNVHHKLEYAVKKNFYHDNDDKTHHAAYDDFDKYFSKKRDQNLSDHKFYGDQFDKHYGLEGHHKKGHKNKHHKGHSKHFGHKGHHGQHHSHGDKGHHDKGHHDKGHADHGHDHYHGHHTNNIYDYYLY